MKLCLKLVSNILFSLFFICTSTDSNILLICALCATSISIGLFLYLSHYDMSETSQPGNNGPGIIISTVRSIRLAIFLITTALIASSSVINCVIDFTQPMLVEIYPQVDDTTNDNITNANSSSTQSLTEHHEMPEIPPIYLFLCGLSLSAISAFLRADFILKLFVMILTVILQTIILHTSQVFEQYEQNSVSM